MGCGKKLERRGKSPGEAVSRSPGEENGGVNSTSGVQARRLGTVPELATRGSLGNMTGAVLEYQWG